MLLLLSACQQRPQATSSSQPPDFAAQCRSQPVGSQRHCRFLREMAWRIRQHSPAPQRHTGARCMLTIDWDARRQRYNVLAARGDEPVCLRAWQTIGSATDLPAPPPGLSGQLIFDFTPGTARPHATPQPAR
ncbi:hypothetical protein BL250_04710 [Erwinia sp. OLTSP20]|nr:hypothetical protein BV501_00685 [Erwinia sp. OAMSP11]PIJ75689.1 hypothetical protein BK416_00835 [Erwinia sp. OLSSP12]PIJ83650.1 hypothetical protein BLD46_09305 [Erwinia sp. OLMTSP26]PIJ84275.1 hypothetical protein BLD47_02730 [Erwinia sp. OLCASP19]PIJ88740.1 hypothetical protein BLD49_01040 [Erwinia sp. OLMDSP33]PIJ90336.1 hypothetical protein BL249_13330 [Erwinia sp. OLFS4]PIJ93986.1 hypothetical protein BL250_04710 [Erwinia sp. OLTSP20]